MSRNILRKKRTKVLILIPFFNLGGAEKQALYLAKALHINPDFEVEIWGFQEGTKMLLSPINEAGIKTVCLNYSFGEFHSRVGRISVYAKFWSKLLFKRFDAIVPFTYHCNVLAASVFRFAFIKKCVWFQIAMEFHIPLNTFEKIALRMRPKYAANSKAAAAFIAKKHNISIKEIFFIPNPFEFENPLLSVKAVRDQLGFKEDDLLILHAANFYPEKDHVTLIKGFAELKKKRSNVHLLLAGDISNSEAVNMIKSKAFDSGVTDKELHFLGSVKDIYSLISASDICVLTSVSEGSPNALLEYMGFEKPVVVSSIPAIVELVSIDYPYLFEPRNTYELANKLEFCISNLKSEQNTNWIQLNFDKITSEYTVKKNADAFISILVNG